MYVCWDLTTASVRWPVVFVVIRILTHYLSCVGSCVLGGQAKQKIVSGRIRMTEFEAVRLAALQMQCEFGDYNAAKHRGNFLSYVQAAVMVLSLHVSVVVLVLPCFESYVGHWECIDSHSRLHTV